MPVFKKKEAEYIQKMLVFSSVMVTSEEVKFQLQYSSLELPIEKIPALLADVMELYHMVKPALDAKSLAEAEKAEQGAEIALSDIPL